MRATAEAAYQSGRTHLDRGELETALIDLDTAKTNDPDNRSDIQQALDEAVRRLQSATPPPTATPRIAVGSTLIRPTAVPAPPTAAPSPTTPPIATGAPAADALVVWHDSQGRFAIGGPGDWQRVEQPQALFGTGIIEFDDPSGHAELGVAVDQSRPAVSPELYAASLELAMQQQMPGYAAEQVEPGSTAGNPSVRRVYTFTRRSTSGQNEQARGFQIVVVKGSVPFIISGSAPADQYARYVSIFDRMVGSFTFS